MARKPKTILENDTFEDDHSYYCYRCGRDYANPTGKFYKSQWSESFIKNTRYVPLCKTCVKEMFERDEKKYGTKVACILMCYRLDIPYYYSLYDSIIKNNNTFSIGLYTRQMNNRQYRYQDFSQSILLGEINKTSEEFEVEKETKWSSTDSKNRDYCIEIVGYDPFDGYPEQDRKFLFNQLFPYLEDDGIADDAYKLSQLIQIVDNNKQIHNCDVKIANLDPIKDATEIKTLNGIKKDLVSSNDKIAKENEISVKNRSDKNAGKSTLTYRMRELRELDFDKAEADYYDQLRSAGTLWAIEMSNKAVLANGLFDDSDKKEVYEENLKLINDLYAELDDKKEQIRLLTKENDELKRRCDNGET